MIYIVPKPTDSDGDNSTAAVINELEILGEKWELLSPDIINPFHNAPERALIWICGMKQDQHQFEVLNALSLNNRCCNTPEAIATCASKVLTSALLIRHLIPTPKTFFSNSKEAAIKFLNANSCVVEKPVYGYDGVGVGLVTKENELTGPPFYLQEYIKNERDYRIFVINGKAVGAIMRESPHLAHNIHQGGTGTPVPLNNIMEEISVKAAEAVSADYCGVDLLEIPGGYTVLEVNGTPNWHCMSAPIPRLLARFLSATHGEVI